jgi:hypothetical protein
MQENEIRRTCPLGAARAFVWGLVAAALLCLAAQSRAAAIAPSRDETFAMLESENYAKLEEITGNLRQARLGFYNGWPPIHVFYGNLSFSTTDASVWNKYIALLGKWAAAYPESPTPRIALANLYRDYAWEARGSGYADSVTTEGWKLFGERIEMAQGILNGAKAMKTEDAEAYYLQLILDKAMGHSRAEMESSFTKGLKLNPDFTPIYSAKAEYLLPRWSGGPGDWESYAAQAADRMGGDNGDILYMFIVRSVAYTEGSSLFNDSLLSYPRMKKGFLAARARYPDNTWDLNSFCYFASIAGDHDTAVDLFKRIGDNYVEDVWGSRNDFEYWKAKVSGGEVLAYLMTNAREIVEIAGVTTIVLLTVAAVYLLGKSRSQETAG